MSCPVSIEHPVLCRLLRPAVLLHLAAPKITQNGGQTWARVGRLQFRDWNRKWFRWHTKMMSKCRKCHLRETKFAKFPGGACPQTPLEARAVGARLSAFGANRASLFLLKRGWNVWMGDYNSAIALKNSCFQLSFTCKESLKYKKLIERRIL